MKFFLFLLLLISSGILRAQMTPQNGVAASKPKLIALKNAKIIISADKIIESGTLLIEGNKILDAGRLLVIPDHALVYDLNGATVMPAFIELNTSLGIPKNQNNEFEFKKPGQKNADHWNEAIHPETNASELFSIDAKANEELVKMGFGFAVTHVHDGIAQGSGALISLGSENANKQILHPLSSQFFSLEKGISKNPYPSSQMGTLALLRQTFYDTKWYSQGEACESNLSLDALKRNASLPMVFSTKDKWEILRLEKIANEFNYRFNYIGSGNEYLAIKQLKFVTGHVIVPINFPEPYDVKDPYVSRQIPLADLKHWELAPSNPSILKKNGVKLCLSSNGQKNAESFWKNIKKSIERGLMPMEALSALTIEPAKLLGLEKEYGSLENGKVASFSVYSADPFTEDAKLLEVWMLGEQKVFESLPAHNITGKYNLLLEGQRYPLEISGTPEKPQGKILTIKQKTNPETGLVSKDSIYPKVEVKLNGNDLVLQFNLDDDRFKGSVNLHAKVNSKLGVFEGDGTLPNGKWIQWTAIRNAGVEDKAKKIEAPKVDTSYTSLIWSPNMAYGHKEIPTAETIVFRNVTVWTNEAEGILKDATVISQNGKITFVGNGTISIPTDAKEIDGKGLHLTSGIIDEHSHIAISKGVNEGGQAISAEVRIGDVLNSEDINIYRQLSGGVTAAQLLHGSANPIGGQSALIKLKWGSYPEEMLIPNAPKFIKCALGENVKQSNFGEYGSRFPQTRMGVEQVFYDGFKRATNYQTKWTEYKAKGGIEPRKDLELEVLSEILRSERFITCHSYVQSEINMLMHVADSMNFKINTFTHILEGYKVADKMKQHGVGASTFSDWWAYKFEVNDAIPYNAAMMHQQGLTVAINSDDAEMGRRLNQEAAKSVKYGGMSEEDAWKMVTLNPAKLLHLDDRMGSVKVGKDADLVLWSANPLSIDAQVKLTIIDGVVLYDQSKNVLLETQNQQEKSRIISKMLESNERGEESKPFVKKKAKHFHCNTLGEEGSEEENGH